MKAYTTTETGITLGGGPEVSWQDLSDALASVMNPFSSAHLLRRALQEALDADEVGGDTGILRAILDHTAPRLAEHPEWSNEEIAQVTGRED